MLRQALLRAGALASTSQSSNFVRAFLTSALQNTQGVAQSTASCSAHVRSFATNSHDIFNVHYDAPHNNPQTKFDFTEENYEKVAEVISRYPSNYKASAVIPLLFMAQEQNEGWLSLAAMNRVAQILEMPPIRVYEVATFYTMFNRSKIGKYHVMVCGTTPCMLQGAQGIYEALKTHLKVDYGETTKDGMFTLGEMECMGACVNAPMIAVADYTKGVEGFSYLYYEDLTPEDAINIVEALRKGDRPKRGSQHRLDAEPAGAVINGKWVSNPPPPEGITLTSPPPGPYCRNLDDPPPPPPPPAGEAPAGGAPPPPKK